MGDCLGVSWDLPSEVGGFMSGGPWLRLGLVPFAVWDVEMTIIWPRSRSSLPLPCSPQWLERQKKTGFRFRVADLHLV
jgi:hypothetical protein